MPSDNYFVDSNDLDPKLISEEEYELLIKKYPSMVKSPNRRKLELIHGGGIIYEDEEFQSAREFFPNEIINSNNNNITVINSSSRFAVLNMVNNMGNMNMSLESESERIISCKSGFKNKNKNENLIKNNLNNKLSHHTIKDNGIVNGNIVNNKENDNSHINSAEIISIDIKIEKENNNKCNYYICGDTKSACLIF
jgi:hypothetical protein